MNGSISFTGDLTGSIDQGGGTGSVPVVTATATIDANTGTPEVSVTRTGTDANPNFNFGFKNLKGAKGDTGAAGQNGANGSDGFSPAVTLSSISGGTRVSITDATHPSGQIFDVMNGQNGQNGADGTNGTNGVSPAVTISTITGGHRVNITDATHPSGQNFDVMDGQRGETGSQGPQGEQGPAGVGIAVGGTPGQILKKAGASDYVTGWFDNEAAGVSFDNTGLEIITHDTVQLALEDLDAAVDTVNSSLTNLFTNVRYGTKVSINTANPYTCPSMGIITGTIRKDTSANAGYYGVKSSTIDNVYRAFETIPAQSGFYCSLNMVVTKNEELTFEFNNTGSINLYFVPFVQN